MQHCQLVQLPKPTWLEMALRGVASLTLTTKAAAMLLTQPSQLETEPAAWRALHRPPKAQSCHGRRMSA